jgi:hypothetical protein
MTVSRNGGRTGGRIRTGAGSDSIADLDGGRIIIGLDKDLYIVLIDFLVSGGGSALGLATGFLTPLNAEAGVGTICLPGGYQGGLGLSIII